MSIDGGVPSAMGGGVDDKFILKQILLHQVLVSRSLKGGKEEVQLSRAQRKQAAKSQARGRWSPKSPRGCLSAMLCTQQEASGSQKAARSRYADVPRVRGRGRPPPASRLPATGAAAAHGGTAQRQPSSAPCLWRCVEQASPAWLVRAGAGSC